MSKKLCDWLRWVKIHSRELNHKNEENKDRPIWFIKVKYFSLGSPIKEFLEIREMLPPAPAAPTIKMADARNRAIARGFTNDQFEEAVEEYEELDVFTVNAARTRLTVVGDN